MSAAVIYSVSVFTRWSWVPRALEIMLDAALASYVEREFPELMKEKP